MATKKPAALKPLEFWLDVDKVLAELGQLDPEKTTLEAELAARIQQAKDELEPSVARLAEKIDLRTEAITAFVVSHRKELDENRTANLTHGSVSLRLSPPKLVTIGKTTWKKVLELIGNLAPSLQRKMIRTKPELDKEAIKEMIETGKLDDETRREIQVDLIQEENVRYSLASETAAARG